MSLSAAAYLARCTAERLVDHDACVGHGVPFVLRASTQQERAHRRRQAKAVCLHIAPAHLHDACQALNAIVMSVLWSLHDVDDGQGLEHCCWQLRTGVSSYHHGVIDAHACRDRAAWRVDEQLDVLRKCTCTSSAPSWCLQ